LYICESIYLIINTYLMSVKEKKETPTEKQGIHALFPLYQELQNKTLSLDMVEFKVQAEPNKDEQEGCATIITYITADSVCNQLDASFAGCWSKTVEAPYATILDKKNYKSGGFDSKNVAGYRCIIEINHPATFEKILSRDGHAEATDIEAIKGGDTGSFKRAAAALFQNIRDLRKSPKYLVQCDLTNRGLKAPAPYKIYAALSAAYGLFLDGKINGRSTVYVTTNQAAPEAPAPRNTKGGDYFVMVDGVIVWAAKMRPIETLTALLDAIETAQALADFWANLGELERPLISAAVGLRNKAYKEQLLDLINDINTTDGLKEFYITLTPVEQGLCLDFVKSKGLAIDRQAKVAQIANLQNLTELKTFFVTLTDAQKADLQPEMAAQKSTFETIIA
jgi:hypothetical protein